MALTVKWGFPTSSIRYNTRSDGRAIKIRIIAGKIVHVVSTTCAFIVPVCVKVVVISRAIMYSTNVLIRNTTIIAWSCR